MPGRRPSGVRPVYAACPISPISPISPASSGGRGAVGKVFSRLNPFSVFLPLWAGRGCPGGDARTTFPYFGSRKHPVSPGRVQRRRPVRVLPRRRTAEGGLPLPPIRVQCRFAFGEVRCGIYPRKKKLFFAGPGAEPRSVRSYRRKRGDGPYEPFFRVGSCCGRSLRSTAREGGFRRRRLRQQAPKSGAPRIGGCLRSAGFGVYGSFRAVRFRGPRFENVGRAKRCWLRW